MLTYAKAPAAVCIKSTAVAGDNASSSESAMFVLPAAQNITGQN
jgi:hypothetical protein